MSLKNEGQQKLIEEFPLKVGFPKLAGQFYLLHHHCEWEKSCISVGRSIPAVVKLFKDAYTKYNGLKARGLYLIDIVSPPDSAKLRFAKSERDHERSSFSSTVGWYLEELLKHDKVLPPGFKSCDAPQDEGYGSHSSCGHCHDGFVYNLKEVYAKKRDLYRERAITDPRQASIAPPADPDRKLYIIRTGMDGSPLELVKKQDSYFSDGLFFCHATPLDLPEDLVAWVNEQKRKEEAERKAWELENEERILKNQREELERIRAFFK
jgi:hypothetical protein